MKKLLLLLLVIGLSQCKIKIEPKIVKANEFNTFYIASPTRGCNGNSRINVTVYYKDNIEYRVFTNDGYDSKSIFVVNHTEELLKIKNLKLQIKLAEKEF